MSRTPASPPSPAVRVAATVVPCARDPRIRTELPVDPRLQSSTSFHQTAVVLPTQAKPSPTVTTQPDSATQVVPQATSSSTVENIFDRLLKDLKVVKSESAAMPPAADGGTCATPAAELKTDNSAVEPGASKDQLTVNQETDDGKRAAASPSQASGMPDDLYHDSNIVSRDMQIKADLQRAASHSPTPSRAETKDSDAVCDDTGGPSRTQEGDRCSDRSNRHRGGPRSSRRRASSQDREKLREVVEQRTDVRGKEKDAGPAAKRMRHDRQQNELKNIDSSASLPTDFM